MCGICGIYNYSNKDNIVSENILRQMSSKLHHRGPDDEGYYTAKNFGVGHKRLSIIDLSPMARQPITTPDGRYTIVLNGEIYNYLELRQELLSKGYKFRSHSDTEVLLYLYESEGKKCLNRLNGMFAFVIWDNINRTLFAARDHFGIKPFYYYYNSNTFIFASEIKAILEPKIILPEINFSALQDYLTFQFCLDNKTLFKNIQKLLPGHYLTLTSNGNLSIKKYWELDFTVDTYHTEEYFQHKLLRLLEDSVRLQLRADVQIGSHLSGGLDSSAVTCLVASLLNIPIQTFSGGFKDSPKYDETAYARIVSENSKTIHNEIYPTSHDFVEILPKLIYAMDEPVAGPGLFPQYFVSKLASEKVKVVLGGQGGDEIFGGYTRYLIAYLEECIRGGINGTQEESKYVVTFESILPNLRQLQGYQPLLRYFWQDGLFDTPEKRYFRLIDRSNGFHNLLNKDILNESSDYNVFENFKKIFNESNTSSYINRMTHFDMKTLLPALLHVEDRTSMMVSLESRVPLLDYRIVELVTSIPPMLKYKGGRSKHIFREVVQHIVPDEILQRKDKMGFPVPLNEWYKESPVKDFVHSTLLSQKAKERGIFNTAQIEELLKTERPFGRIIWGLLSLELWMQSFLS